MQFFVCCHTCYDLCSNLKSFEYISVIFSHKIIVNHSADESNSIRTKLSLDLALQLNFCKFIPFNKSILIKIFEEKCVYFYQFFSFKTFHATGLMVSTKNRI